MNRGFVDEGRDRQVIWMRGTWKDLLRMGILEYEWDAWKAQNPEAAKSLVKGNPTPSKLS